MSSVGDLLMVVCDKLYIPYVCISSYLEFGIMREFLCEEQLEETYCWNVYSKP